MDVNVFPHNSKKRRPMQKDNIYVASESTVEKTDQVCILPQELKRKKDKNFKKAKQR